jgi:hypothetical protein
MGVMGMRVASAALLIVLISGGVSKAAPPRVEVGIEALSAALDLEKKTLLEDVEESDRLASRVIRAQGDASQAAARFVQLVKDGGVDRQTMDAAEEAAVEARARASGAEDRRLAVLSRMGERSRHIVALRDEISRRRAVLRSGADPLSGRWEVMINPGSRRGVYRLNLDGTLISGDYTLDGSFRGSLRGTYIGDRVTLERIDSERGLDATFYGRLNAAQKRLVGTWDGTQIAPAYGPTAGTWSGVMQPDRDESEGDRP